ncbi:hypothetical protein B0O99DRAFT_523672 [Bisporella sp. PMI_857]|nr:hypothetical protein B0O99DRAFT_523672 [Bisporella sp. PMI_857]
MDLCKIPAGKAPDGETYNLIDPPSLSPNLIAVAVIMTTFSTVFFTGRIYLNIRNLTLPDSFVIFGYLCSVAFTGTVLAVVKYARHQWDIPACWFTGKYLQFSLSPDAASLRILFVNELLLTPAQFFSKASILLLYFQLFSVRTWMRVCIIGGIVFAFLIYFISWVTVPYFAAPHAGETWTEMLTKGRSTQVKVWGPIQGTCSIILDVFIFVLPLSNIWGLNMSLKKQFQLTAVFATALLGVIASVVNGVYRFGLLSTTDYTWQAAKLFLWNMVEIDVAVIVSSMPAFANFVKNNITSSAFFNTLRSRLSGTQNSSSQNHPYVNQSSTTKLNRSLRTKPSKTSSRSQSAQKTYVYELTETTPNTATITQPVGSSIPPLPDMGDSGFGKPLHIHRDTRPHYDV